MVKVIGAVRTGFACGYFGFRLSMTVKTRVISLSDADSDILLMLGKNIGKTDTDDQLKNIRYIKTMIGEQEKQAQGEYSRFGKLYQSGGVLVGLMLVIILI